MGTPTKGTAKITTPSDTQIRVSREFGAPRHLVFRAMTTPELIKKWWSGGLGEVTVAEVDLRVGGTWRYVIGDEQVAFHGEYLEIVADERIVCTEVYEGGPAGPPVVCTYEFTETDGRTTLTLTTDAPSIEVRDLILQSGMEQGLQAGYDLLEEVAIREG